jgi:protein-disulfide isomerase
MSDAQTGVLTPPVSDDDHAIGRPDAPITLVEFGDFECPYCGRAYSIVKEVQSRFGDQLRFMFRNFPLTQIHPHAEHAAEAAEAAGAQGAFWEMHDVLFEHQNALEDVQLAGYASLLGLDVERVERELADEFYASNIRQHFVSGVRSGVNGTPTFFINGIRHDDAWDLAGLTAAIDRALRRVVT